jgi:2-isopropylmalate synthase
VIRVNSQSGKGGMAYLLEQMHGIYMPRRLQIEFSRAVQAMTDETGLEASAADLYALFRREYLDVEAPLRYVSHRMVSASDTAAEVEIDIVRDGRPMRMRGTGNGPIDAAVDAFTRGLGVAVRVMDYHEHAMTTGADANAACYVEVRVADSATGFGAGVDPSIVTASLKAVVSGNRHLQTRDMSSHAQGGLMTGCPASEKTGVPCPQRAHRERRPLDAHDMRGAQPRAHSVRGQPRGRHESFRMWLEALSAQA